MYVVVHVYIYDVSMILMKMAKDLLQVTTVNKHDWYLSTNKNSQDDIAC